MNDNGGHKSGTMSSFQKNAGSACSILMAVYVSGGFEENAPCLLLRYRHRSPVLFEKIWTAVGYTILALLVRINGNLTQICTFLTCYIQWLCSVFKACHTQFSNKICKNTWCTSYSNIPRYTWCLTAALACMASIFVTHWNYLIMDWWEIVPLPLSS